MPVAYRWLSLRQLRPSAASIGLPPPFDVSEGAVLAQIGILLVWLPLSYPVWRGHIWAKCLVGYSSLVLGLAQCVQYHWILRRQPLYQWLNLSSDALILAVPTFFLSAIMFCPTIGRSFSDAHKESR